MRVVRIRIHRGTRLAMLVSALGLIAALPSACSSDDDESQLSPEDEKRRLDRAKGGTEFVPVEAPSAPPPLPPGAGPYNGPPPTPDQPMMPVVDSGNPTETGPKDTSPPQDVMAQ